MPVQTSADFSHLTPEAVIEAVEKALGVRCTNLCRPLTSYINRVYEVGLEEGGFAIAKFYRPGRWDRMALEDEMEFLSELAEAEVPVVPPLPGSDGGLLHELGATFFALFPKRGGRPLDEPAFEVWPQLGRLIGRMHSVGARHAPRHRVLLHPRHSTREHLDYILRSGTVSAPLLRPYEQTVTNLIELMTPLFEGLPTLRVHGDCHRANILCRPDEGFHLLDFDDMAVGPAVQDLWLLLPDRLRGARAEAEAMIEGYETFWPFPPESLALIEPLRAMRFIHFTAWCARQKSDGGFARLLPGWGAPEFWRQEISDLERQRREILDAAE